MFLKNRVNLLDTVLFLLYNGGDMKRIRVSLSAGCYAEPSHGVLAYEIPVLFDDRDFNCMLYDEDLERMPVIGKLWYMDLCRVPSIVYCEDEADLDLVPDRDVDMEEVQHEDECRPRLRGKRRDGVDYELEWKYRYEGVVKDEFCDGKLAGCFCWEHEPVTNEVVGCRLVLKKGDYRRNGAFVNVRVVEE